LPGRGKKEGKLSGRTGYPGKDGTFQIKDISEKKVRDLY